MLRRIITEEIAGFMVGITELTAAGFYRYDRALAFKELNDKKVWHYFVEKYEETCSLPTETIVRQIGQMLGTEDAHIGNIGLMEKNDEELIKMIIRELGKKYNWNYSVSFEKFYSSGVCRMMSGAKISLSALSLEEIIKLFDDSFTE